MKSASEGNNLTLSDWIETAIKKSKSKDISDLLWKIDDNFSILPLQIKAPTTFFPPVLDADSSWQIGQTLTVKNNSLNSSNEALLLALKYGVNAPRFEISEALSMSDFNTLFQKVKVEYLYPTFSFNDFGILDKSLAEWDQFVTAQNIDKNSHPLRLVFYGDQTAMIPVYNQYHADYPQAYFFTFYEPELSDDRSKIKSMTSLLQATIDFCVSHIDEPNALRTISWELEGGMDYLIEMARIRAVKWCWVKALESFDIQDSIAPFYNWNVRGTKTFDQELIRSTLKAIAGIQAGVDRVDIYLPENDPAYPHLGRNIQNILQLESQVDQAPDPVKGSYFLEVLTYKMAQRIWEGIDPLFESK